MVGRAVLTIVWSSVARNMPEHQPGHDDQDLPVRVRRRDRLGAGCLRGPGRLSYRCRRCRRLARGPARRPVRKHGHEATRLRRRPASAASASPTSRSSSSTSRLRSASGHPAMESASACRRLVRETSSASRPGFGRSEQGGAAIPGVTLASDQPGVPEGLDVAADRRGIQLQRYGQVRQPDRRQARQLGEHPVAAAIQALRRLTAGLGEPAQGREQRDFKAQLFIHAPEYRSVAC